MQSDPTAFGGRASLSMIGLTLPHLLSNGALFTIAPVTPLLLN
jgi:hypothetical protein